MPVYSIFFNISVQFSRSVVFDSATPWTAACQASLSITSSWSLVKSLSRVRLFVTPWTAAHQAPQSMGFSRQEYWSGLPFPSPGDLPDPGIKPGSPALEADALTSEPQTHIHRVSCANQPSHPLSSPSPPAFSLSQHQVLFK